MGLFKSLRLVKAGRAGAVLPTNCKEVNAERWKAYETELKDRQVYCVIGESMSPEGIHSDNLLIASRILTSECVEKVLKYGDFIILQIPDNKSVVSAQGNLDLKMRKYLMQLDITQPAEDLWEEVQKKDSLSRGEDAKAIFMEKLNESKKRIPESDCTNILLSITYTAEHGREYSFHSRKMLVAKVIFYIDNNNQKKDFR